MSESVCLPPGYPDHMTLADFRCHFQALSPPIMKRYASMFISHDERKVRWHVTSAHSLEQNTMSVSKQLIFVFVSQAVEELLVELDLDKKSIVVGASRVSMSEF